MKTQAAKIPPHGAPEPKSALKLSYEGGLPEILRLIATELDLDRATAESFTAEVGRDFFNLSVSLRLR